MRIMMKKRLAKGILAAAFAFVTVLGALQYGTADSSLTAHAACSHHCQHYSSFGKWEEVECKEQLIFLTPVRISTQIQLEYDTCSNCGYKKQYKTHCRMVYTYYRWSGAAYKTAIEVLC